MKGDFSKDTFNAKKHFHDVLMQQGRVLLDTDWNEQADLTTHRIETETIDTIGKSGAPMHDAGFGIITVNSGGNPASPGMDIKLSKGRYYVDGILCENEDEVLFAAQPDYDGITLPNTSADNGDYVFYLDVWQRLITALEDPDIREVALGGPDTTTRSKTIWQVKYKKVTGPVNCLTALPADVVNAPTGKMNARSELTAGTSDPCGLVTSGGYRRLENQLYRVEIHKGGPNRASTTFKWSRDNGSVLVKWESHDLANPNNLIVSSTGRDEMLGFRSGSWIELIDDSTDLLSKQGVLVQLANVDGNVLTINPATIKDPNNPGTTTVTRSTKNPRIRRWDSDGDVSLNTNNNIWIALEDGVEVNFLEGIFRTGDFWLIPARTAKADIEWPFTTPQLPQGIQHHFAKLAIVSLSVPAGGSPMWTLKSDCRNLFPPLTELISLYYVGGDGQEAMPGNTLPNSLKVGVANGQWAVTGAKVKFEIVQGGGSLNPASGIVTTDVEGIAQVQWTIGTNFLSDLHLQVRASLLDATDNIAPNHLPVIFHASFSIAENVFYKSTCGNWTGNPPATVAEALDQLCERKSGKGGCCYKIDPKGDGDFKTLLEAIEKLSHKDEEDVCLCFMPGDHEIDEDILMFSKDMKFTSLKITGYNARIAMTASRVELVANKIILLGIFLTAAKIDFNPDKPNDAQIMLVSDEINMDYCTWNRPGNSEKPFVFIPRGCLVYFKYNKFLGWFSLVLANGVVGVLEGNIIGYLMLQFGGSEPFKPQPLFWINDDVKALTQNTLHKPNEVNQTDWSLTIRGNRLGAIVTDVNRKKPQDLYQDLFISENIFQFPGNSFAGKFLNVVNNQFLFTDNNPDHKPVTLAYVVGVNLIVMGNNGVTTKPSGHFGGLLGTIDVIVLSTIRGGGIGPAQTLNLVNVDV